MKAYTVRPSDQGSSWGWDEYRFPHQERQSFGSPASGEGMVFTPKVNLPNNKDADFNQALRDMGADVLRHVFEHRNALQDGNTEQAYGDLLRLVSQHFNIQNQ